MTDREVIEYLSNHQTACGRFRNDQIDTPLTIPKVDNGFFRWRTLFLGLLPLLSFKAFALPFKAPTDQSPAPKVPGKDTSIAPPKDSLVNISGTVVNEKDEPLAGASVALLDTSGEGTTREAFTDSTGNFSFALKMITINRSSRILHISSGGYASKVIEITDDRFQKYNVILDMPAQHKMMGMMMVTYPKLNRLKQ